MSMVCIYTGAQSRTVFSYTYSVGFGVAVWIKGNTRA